MVLKTKRTPAGAETVEVTARSPLLDLANGVVQRTEADGTVTLLFTLLSLTVEELVDVILDDAPAFFKKGVIANSTLVIPTFTFDLDSPLSALQELADLAGIELAVRRDGDNGFFVDLPEKVGQFDQYPSIRVTVTDDIFLAQSAPNTNLGGGVSYKIQRGPSTGFDADAVIKFDLTWLVGTGLRIIGASLTFKSIGGGSGTLHALELVPLRSAASGPFTGQPREIAEFQSTFNSHLTGRLWAGPGARATNDDRDNANEWTATLADQTAGNLVTFTGQNVLSSATLAQFLQTIVDGTDAFFKDGFARFVFDASPSGQSGKFSFFHSDDAVLFADRPQLLLTLAQDTPHFVLARNLQGIERESDERDLVNRIYAVGGGGPEQGIRLTLGSARWVVATVPTATTFTITEQALFEDGHLVGNFVDPLDGSGPFLITATVESGQEVETSTPHGLIVGQVIAFILDALGTQLVFVESPSSQTNFGVVNGVQVENDLPLVDNVVANAALKNFTAGSPDNWTALGAATLAEETDPLFTQIGGSAVRVTTTAVVGDGIRSDAITLAPVGARVFFSCQVFLFVESGGGVEVFLDHSVDGRFPVEGAAEAAFTTELGVFIEISIEGVEFGPGLLTINVVNKEATAGVFFLDGAQLINLANKQPFFERRASVELWQRGLDALAINNIPKLTHRLPQALDLTGFDPANFPYDQVRLGGDVFVDDDRLDIQDLVTRVLRLREDLLQSAIVRMELQNFTDTLIDQLSARERRTRQVEPPPAPKQAFQAVTASVIDTGEVLIAVTGGLRMRSYKFLVRLDTPEPYDVVVASGSVSNVIDGSAVFTGFFMETGELAFVRCVAYRQVSAGGRPGATEVRAVSLTPGTTSLVRARVEFSADHTQLVAAPAAALPWDVEVYDVGNLHEAVSPELLTAPIPGQYLLIYGIAWAAPGGAATGDRRQGILEMSAPQAGGSIDYNKPGAHTGIAWGLNMLASASEAHEAEVHNTTGADITITAVDSFFQAVRIAIRSDQHRVWVESTTHSIADATDTVVSFSLASDFERVDTGAMFDKVGAPTRITFQRSVPFLVIVQGVWSGQVAGVGTAALRRTDLRLNGTTRFARAEFQEPDGQSLATNLFSQPLAKFIEPTAADFMEVLVRQESGGAIDWGSRLNALGQATGLVQAFELPGGLNPRASVSLSANELIATATPTAIPWDNEDTDVDAMVDIGTFPTRITVNTPGMYVLIAQIAWASAVAGIRRITIKEGASLDRATREIVTPDGTFTGTVMVAMPVEAGTFFEVEVEQTSGAGLNVLSADSFFQAIRIGNL